VKLCNSILVFCPFNFYHMYRMASGYPFSGGCRDGDGSAEGGARVERRGAGAVAIAARSRSLPAALVRRANIVLACAAGAPNSAVAQRFGTTNATVGKWRRRFVVRRIEGLYEELPRANRARSTTSASPICST
jgi:hypothetical protein